MLQVAAEDGKIGAIRTPDVASAPKEEEDDGI
jgi:hypothetical protein